MERICFQLEVKPERMDEYVERHRRVWPDMLAALAEAGWRNYSLFLREDGLLIGYVECESFEAAEAAMSRTDVNERWQAEMAPFFVSSGPQDGLRRLTEVFNLDAQLSRSG